jgi:hypothetical protein
MLSVANKPIMLSVVMMNDIILNVVMLSVVMLNVVMLCVVMLNVVALEYSLQLIILSLKRRNFWWQKQWQGP